LKYMIDIYQSYRSKPRKYMINVILKNLDKVDIYMLFRMIYKILDEHAVQFQLENPAMFKDLIRLCQLATNPYYQKQFDMVAVINFMHSKKLDVVCTVKN